MYLASSYDQSRVGRHNKTWRKTHLCFLRSYCTKTYHVMNSKHIGADYIFAWLSAKMAVMGPEGACNIIFRKEITGSKNPEEKRVELVEYYKKEFSNRYIAGFRFRIDATDKISIISCEIRNKFNSFLQRRIYILYITMYTPYITTCWKVIVALIVVKSFQTKKDGLM